MNCKNCHKPIEWYNALEGEEGHWMHSHSFLQACSINTSGQWAEPEEETK